MLPKGVVGPHQVELKPKLQDTNFRRHILLSQILNGNTNHTFRPPLSQISLTGVHFESLITELSTGQHF